MRDVGDVHAHFHVAAVQRAAVEGVVNVSAPGRVHAADVEVPEVRTPLQLLPGYGPGHGGQVRQHGLREGVVGHVVLEEEDLVLRGLVPYRPQLPHKVAPREARPPRPGVYAHHYPLPQEVLGLAGLDEHPGHLALGGHEGVTDPLHARAGEEGPAVGPPVALYHSHDPTGRLDQGRVDGRSL